MNNLFMLLDSVSQNGNADTTAISMVVGIVVIVGAIGIITFSLKNKENGEGMLKEFFDLLADKIKEVIIETLTTHNISELINSKDPYKELIEKIYEKVFDTCTSKAEEVAKENNNIILEKILELLTREKVIEYVDTILDKDTDIKDKITEIINIANEKNNIEAEEADKARSEELKEDVIENLDELEASGEVIDNEMRDTPQLDANFKPIKQEINPPIEDDYDVTDTDDGTTEEVDDGE